MFLNQTSNYQLSQWDAEDRILRTDFNSDNAKIDAALKANANAISSESSTRASAVSSLISQLAKKGNVRVEIQTYVGTGEYGDEHPNSVTFSEPPFLLLIGSGGHWGCNIGANRTMKISASSYMGACHGTWSGGTYTWSDNSAASQLNSANAVFTVLGFFLCD